MTTQQTPDFVLTLEDAARLAGVSRPFMARLIDAGVIKCDAQQSVRRSAVLHWQAAERARQAQSLKQLAEELDAEIFSS